MPDKPLNPGVMERVLSSDRASIERIVPETEAFLEKRVTDEYLAYRIVLLTVEAVTNAIEHGNRFDRTKQVRFRMEAAGQRIEVAVEDEGKGFNPATPADPLACENLLQEGGRGLLFMQSMADEVLFENDGRKVRLIFHAG